MEIVSLPPEQHLNALYRILEERPNYLAVDGTFVHTALHCAAQDGATLLAAEMLLRSPSLGFQLNRAGLSPLHLAIESGLRQAVESGLRPGHLAIEGKHKETILSLIRICPELIGVQGREGKTPLHLVAERGAQVILGEFLATYPDAINKLTIRGESAAHLALKNDMVDSFLIVHGWLLRTGRLNVLNWRDWKDNTLLHIATEKNKTEVIRILVIQERVFLNGRNSDGRTPLEMTKDRNIERMLLRNGAKRTVKHCDYSDYFKEKLKLVEGGPLFNWVLELKLTSEQRNVVLVVMTLICTATFQAMVQTPNTMSNEGAKVTFAVTNAVSFLVSALMINNFLPRGRHYGSLHIGLYFFLLAYVGLASVFMGYKRSYVMVIAFLILHMLLSFFGGFLVRHFAPSSFMVKLPVKKTDWMYS